MQSTLILHDYFATAEGGGRLCTILAAGLGADLGYGFVRPGHPFVQAGGAGRDLRQYSPLPLWQQFKLARAFQTRTAFVRDYQTLIYSGFYTPLAIKNHPEGKNILYCHTPPRFIYDQRDFYRARLPAPLRPLLQAFVDYLQPRYEAALRQMDVIVTNSRNVQQRIRHYLGLEAEIVHPPCDTARFRWRRQGDYYLSVARLDPLKRVDRVVAAFLRMPDKQLIVTSGGPELKRLRKLAGHAANIRFTGRVDDATLAKLIGEAIAVIYVPRDEDFGMSPLEAMAAGKPVIGVAEGGLLETVVPEETGVLTAAELTPDQLCAAVDDLTPQRALAMRTACEARADAFRSAVFITRMQRILAGTSRDHADSIRFS